MKNVKWIVAIVIAVALVAVFAVKGCSKKPAAVVSEPAVAKEQVIVVTVPEVKVPEVKATVEVPTVTVTEETTK